MLWRKGLASLDSDDERSDGNQESQDRDYERQCVSCLGPPKGD